MLLLSTLSKKVHVDPWRVLEALLRWIVLGREDGVVSKRPEPGAVAMVEAPDLRFGALGHGCLEAGREAFGAATFERRSLSRPAEACVVGESAAARDIVRRLVALGARTHATAATVEEHAAALADGASPHRAEDLPSLMPRMDIVISTDRSHFLHARLISRLPERALIVDFAGPPGSVDFETAKRLGRDVIWARTFALTEPEGDLWTVIRARAEAPL